MRGRRGRSGNSRAIKDVHWSKSEGSWTIHWSGKHVLVGSAPWMCRYSCLRKPPPHPQNPSWFDASVLFKLDDRDEDSLRF